MEAEIKFFNRKDFSDTTPFEVIKKISNKKYTIREMTAKISTSWKPEMISGGFSAHCVNNCSQVWDITSDESAPVIIVKLLKKGWFCSGDKFIPSDRPVKFHDYNF